MRKNDPWRWAYLAVIAALALVWYEFWTSSTFRDTAPPPPLPATIAAATTTAPTPQPATKPTTEAPIPETPDPKAIAFAELLKSPPPISLTLQNATLSQALAALKKSLGDETLITLNNAGQAAKVITLDAKDQPLWDLLKAIGDQSPFDLQDTAKGLAMLPGAGTLHKFETRGPAILYGISFSYIRSGSGQARPGEAPTVRLQLVLGAAVDPRLHLLRHSSIMLQEAVDDTGQALDVSGYSTMNFTNSESNAWTHTFSLNAPEKMNKRLSLKCLYRFTAQNGEMTVTLDDPQHKVDQPFDFGDRRLNLARWDVQNNRIHVQLGPADNDPDPTKMSFIITDAAGTASPVIQGLVGDIPTGKEPYKLAITGPKARDVTASFELHDLPMP